MASRVSFSLFKTLGRRVLGNATRSLNTFMGPQLRRTVRSYSTYETRTAPKFSKWAKVTVFGTAAAVFTITNAMAVKTEDSEHKPKTEKSTPKFDKVMPEMTTLDSRKWNQGFSENKEDCINAAYFPAGQGPSSYRELLLLAYIKESTAINIIRDMEESVNGVDILPESDLGSGDIIFCTAGLGMDGETSAIIITRVCPNRKNPDDLDAISFMVSADLEKEKINLNKLKTKWGSILKQYKFD